MGNFTLNGKDISGLFDVTCKICGRNDVEILGYTSDGSLITSIECKNYECHNYEEELDE